jgi:hypothetical protein
LIRTERINGLCPNAAAGLLGPLLPHI